MSDARIRNTAPLPWARSASLPLAPQVVIYLADDQLVLARSAAEQVAPPTLIGWFTGSRAGLIRKRVG
jgi:hypothetical protein